MTTVSSQSPFSLISITPSASGSLTLSNIVNTMEALRGKPTFSLELASSAGSLRMLLRSRTGTGIPSLMTNSMQQAQISYLADSEDPMIQRSEEVALSSTLSIIGPEHLPLRTIDDEALAVPGADHLVDIINGMVQKGPTERLVTRLILRPRPLDWLVEHQRQGLIGSGSENQKMASAEQSIRRSSVSFVPVFFAGAVITGILGYQWYTQEDYLKIGLLGGGLGLAGLAYLKLRKMFKPSYKFDDPNLVIERVGWGGFEAQLQIHAFVGSRYASLNRAEVLVEQIESLYSAYNEPNGSQFISMDRREGIPDPDDLLSLPGEKKQSPVVKILSSAPRISAIGSREVATIWHPLSATADEAMSMERTGYKTIAAVSRGIESGAAIGISTGGSPSTVHMAKDTLARHHLYMASTRMGKSTLMTHVCKYLMSEKAGGRNDKALVVVDPHADLVEALLEQIPRDLRDEVVLIDLADENLVPGINLLDSRVFTDRDHTCDGVVNVARGVWQNWGGRMQNILEHTIKALHEANSRMEDPNNQYTLLDAGRMLTEQEFRAKVLFQIRDQYVLSWWLNEFDKWTYQQRSENIAPVQTRLAYFASSVKARDILGQANSTINVANAIAEGKVILISTAQAAVGRDVAALVGASLLNLVDSIVRRQGLLPPEKRRAITVVIDEMQTIPGVDYVSMLSELGKFGGNLILATQSLARLNQVEESMSETLLANIGCLCVFQCGSSDARTLVYELRSDMISSDDITSLPPHNCYVRMTANNERLPPFSMQLNAPATGDREIAAGIRQDARSYTLTAAEAERRLSDKIIRDVAAALQSLRSSLTMSKDKTDIAVQGLDEEKQRQAQMLLEYVNGFTGGDFEEARHALEDFWAKGQPLPDNLVNDAGSRDPKNTR